MENKLSFACRDEVGVQAADLWARELMKRCDSLLFNDRSNPRPQWKLLSDSRRIKADFMRGSDFARDMEEQSDKMAVNPDDYDKWRAENRLVDNLSNRFRYHAINDRLNNENKS